ncbi:MAG: hypothetical protein KGO92_00720 [Bacteroidota bacterium]|nr:hypothetical protein [Bacteroidota bacterium]
MDLDELKYQLNYRLATDHADRSATDIASLLSKKTNSLIGKLKKSLWIEIGFCVLIMLLFLLIGFSSPYQSLQIYFSVFAVVALLFLIILVYLLRRTSQISSNIQMPVKTNLKTIVSIIEEFMKRYFQFTMALIPICFIFSFLLGYNEPRQIPELDKIVLPIFSARWQVLLFAFLYMGLLTVGVYYFTKWYLRKLYGNYIEQLKQCIRELGDEETAI